MISFPVIKSFIAANYQNEIAIQHFKIISKFSWRQISSFLFFLFSHNSVSLSLSSFSFLSWLFTRCWRNSKRAYARVHACALIQRSYFRLVNGACKKCGLLIYRPQITWAKESAWFLLATVTSNTSFGGRQPRAGASYFLGPLLPAHRWIQFWILEARDNFALSWKLIRGRM